MKKFLLLSSLSCLLTFNAISAFAEQCPTPDEIKQQNIGGWYAFDRDNGTPVSGDRLVKFQKHFKLFAQAGYAEGAPEGPAECFYSVKKNGELMNIYLARSGLMPEKNQYWKQDAAGSFSCNENIEVCQFYFPIKK